MTRRKQILLDCCILFLFGAALVRPYFTYKYTNQWPSIESTFISDARFLVEHWPHPQWQPLWYTGTRFDYIYPPALRYGTALLSKVVGFWPVKAYHFYTMFFYSLGIAGVYLLIRAAGRSRGAAWLGAVATAVLSPCFLILREFRLDSGALVPVRLGVLLRYGEGPHITALSLLPFALAFSWRALDQRRPASLALAAIFSAAVVSNNFYGATALAIFYPILLWSFWVTGRRSSMAIPAVAIPALAYGLTAFWMVPSYIRITAQNLQYVALPATNWSIWVAAAVVLAFGLASYKLAGTRPERTWAVFVAGCLVFFSLYVMGNHFLDFRVGGDPRRLVPEFDLVFILAAVLALEWLWFRPGRARKIVVALLVLVAFFPAKKYVRHAWTVIAPWPDYQSRLEYRVTDWLAQHMPEARVCPSGTLRFWFDAWHNLTELGGGSDQGLLNPLEYVGQWEINAGTDPAIALLWLQTFGVDVMYVAEPNSDQPYKDVQHTDRFAKIGPLLFDDGHGNTLYRIPRRWAPRVRVVDTALLDAQQPPRTIEDVERLRPYVDAIENGPDVPATFERPGTDEMLVRAKLNAGQSVLLQETWDPAWQAWQGDARLRLRKDAMGFMVVDAPPGDREIRLVFAMPLENRVGWVLTGISFAVLAGLFLQRERTR
jgi:hypothetical protein